MLGGRVSSAIRLDRSKEVRLGARLWIEWPVYRQLTGRDRLGRRAEAVASKRTRDRRPRVATADKVVKSVCPYCAVGCGQNVYVQDGRVTQIEGDPDSPVSRGRLCPKGSASLQLDHRPGPASTRCCTGGRTAPTGNASTWTRRWT